MSIPNLYHSKFRKNHNFLGGNREYIVIIKSRRISKDNIAMVFIFHFNCIAKV